MVGAGTRRHTITWSGIGNGRQVNGILRKQMLPQAFPALWRLQPMLTFKQTPRVRGSGGRAMVQSFPMR